MANLTLAHTKGRLKLVKQKIKDDLTINEIANKAGGPPARKDNRKCYYCKKKGRKRVGENSYACIGKINQQLAPFIRIPPAPRLTTGPYRPIF